MTVHQDATLFVRAQMLGRIETLQETCATLSLAALCTQLDEVRSLARRNDYHAVEGLASMLESVIAYNGHRQIALNYLALMREAAEGETMGPDSARVYLAAAALQGCR
ncbi:hypothetical protein SLG_37880 [Sphingobium sp. SYK-6]|uniref:hypothetical protein n=1 Tax=Sphingobium sp. (strain NBRC 103272 / SYK-6) TaxID=627192 RepID=UPI0002277F49|nr:hypothetical protein [Sphingobium sp. SYK-6]BAK68463.1 hypothetical protein SLG_37880 [Sphingobium sp. SYK-6]